MFDRDFKDLLSVFDARKVRYPIVGGYAVSFHAQPRATKDLDLLIKPDAENARAVYGALAEFGAPLEGISAEDFMDPEIFFRMGSPPLMVDILPMIPGVEFETAWENRVDVPIDQGSGLLAHFISSRDLLAAKIAAGRPQDLAHIVALHEAELSRLNKAPTSDEAKDLD